jgi:2'-5' RNA ligase
MQAIVTLLDAAANSRIEAVWQMLDLKCGLKWIKKTPYPHFSWQSAEKFPDDETIATLQQVADHTRPFRITTSGLGVFTGSQPVVYLVVTKDERLLRLHKAIWQAIRSEELGVNAYYSPKSWVPHITLAFEDVDLKAVECAMHELALQPLEWEIQVNNLALVGQKGDEVGELYRRFDFRHTQ